MFRVWLDRSASSPAQPILHMAFPCSLRVHFGLTFPLGTVQTNRVCMADLSIHALLTPTHTEVRSHTVPLKVLPYRRTAAGWQSLLRPQPSYPPGALWPYDPFVPWLCCNHRWLDFPRDPAGSPVIQYWLALSRGLSQCLLSTQHSPHRQVFSWKR